MCVCVCVCVCCVRHIISQPMPPSLKFPITLTVTNPGHSQKKQHGWYFWISPMVFFHSKHSSPAQSMAAAGLRQRSLRTTSPGRPDPGVQILHQLQGLQLFKPGRSIPIMAIPKICYIYNIHWYIYIYMCVCVYIYVYMCLYIIYDYINNTYWHIVYNVL